MSVTLDECGGGVTPERECRASAGEKLARLLRGSPRAWHSAGLLQLGGVARSGAGKRWDQDLVRTGLNGCLSHLRIGGKVRSITKKLKFSDEDFCGPNTCFTNLFAFQWVEMSQVAHEHHSRPGCSLDKL